MENAVKLLDGKAEVMHLPKRYPENNKSVEELKRVMLDKGELAQIYNAETPVKYIVCLELKAGCTRAGHYHKTRGEYMYMIRGEAELLLEDIYTKRSETINARERDMILVNPCVAHRITTVVPGHIVEYSFEMYHPDGTVPYDFK